ncbi:hypothetical protein ACFQL0_22600 [Haloplanus litoreus]|uniref:Uncharacterized protein n=1 Tax=Haloplanus litoreus TaxID=767515 RepID=A0ABD6A4Z6_9EURY
MSDGAGEAQSRPHDVAPEGVAVPFVVTVTEFRRHVGEVLAPLDQGVTEYLAVLGGLGREPTDTATVAKDLRRDVDVLESVDSEDAVEQPG